MIILSQYVIVKTLLYVCSERSRAMVQDAYNISYQNAHQYSPKIVRIIFSSVGYKLHRKYYRCILKKILQVNIVVYMTE